MDKKKLIGLVEVEDVLEHFANGGMVILVDDEDRENEGDLTIAAQKVRAEDVAFMAKKGRGLVCLALEQDIVDRLRLKPMTRLNTAPFGTAFLETIDAVRGISDGVNAKDRAYTMRLVMDDKSTPADFKSPGHVFPLAARRGGVLVRTGQTEGSVDLAKLAGLKGGAVICEVMREDGSMMRLNELLEFGARYNIPVLTVASIVKYRLSKESFIEEVAVASLPTEFGTFKLHGYRSVLNDRSHVALVKGDVAGDEPVLVRVHRANFPGDVLPFYGFDSREKLERALKKIAASERGVFVYLNSEAKGADLLDSLRRVSQEGRSGTISRAVKAESEMTFRDYGIGVQIIRSLGIKKMRILTDHPVNLPGLEGFGVDIVDFVPLMGDE